MPHPDTSQKNLEDLTVWCNADPDVHLHLISNYFDHFALDMVLSTFELWPWKTVITIDSLQEKRPPWSHLYWSHKTMYSLKFLFFSNIVINWFLITCDVKIGFFYDFLKCGAMGKMWPLYTFCCIEMLLRPSEAGISNTYSCIRYYRTFGRSNIRLYRIPNTESEYLCEYSTSLLKSQDTKIRQFCFYPSEKNAEKFNFCISESWRCFWDIY